MLAPSLVAIASILADNPLALLQNNVKRILAYSSIAHVGYLLVACLAAGSPDAGNAGGAGEIDRETFASYRIFRGSKCLWNVCDSMSVIRMVLQPCQNPYRRAGEV